MDHHSLEELGIGAGDVEDLCCLRNTPPPDRPLDNINDYLGAPTAEAGGPQVMPAGTALGMKIGGP